MRSGQYSTFRDHDIDFRENVQVRARRTYRRPDVGSPFSVIFPCFWLVVEPINISRPVGCRPARNWGSIAVISIDFCHVNVENALRARDRVTSRAHVVLSQFLVFLARC